MESDVNNDESLEGAIIYVTDRPTNTAIALLLQLLSTFLIFWSTQEIQKYQIGAYIFASLLKFNL